ncbi:MAG: SLC13 family permease [Longimonas sp.]|uniref:SLC13 family permease n=1 Tax=Longimonas sp. TaxID=2039626 RepID=UPI003350063C
MPDANSASSGPDSYAWRQRAGLVAGPVALALILWLPAPGTLDPAGWRTAGVALLMALWWITEALPIPATALVPVVLFPLLGISSVSDATTPYANPLIFLFLGGFLIAIAMQRWDLHRRIALRIITCASLQRSPRI